MGKVIGGIGVSPGMALGPCVVLGEPPVLPVDEPASGEPDAGQARVLAAFGAVADELDRRSAAASGQAADILSATAMMARDPMLMTSVQAALQAGTGPATAVHEAVEQVCAVFTAAGGYLAERTTDLRDVGARVVARLLGVPEPGVPAVTEPAVLIARDLAPADAATLSAATTLAIVTELGGPTGHTAILAAELGIPAVVHAAGALQIPPGTVVAVDGAAGTVTVDPDPAESARLAEQIRERATQDAAVSGPGATRDGHPVAILANLGAVADARAAAATGVEGVGLLRTEFLFLDRSDAPTVAEQTAVYRQLLAAFTGRRVVVRTLDAGADKPLAFADLGPESNPALGVRGLRLMQKRPDLLDDQLAALAAAASDTGAHLGVMAPMVATPGEAAWFAARVRAAGLPSAGVMIEIPAAALRAEQILAEVDFASIGTNDLAQYAMAADRTQGELADLLDPWQPAVLDLVAATTGGAAAAGKPVGVCGEAGGDPLLALVLVGLGVSSLSMAAARAPAVRAALRRHDLAQCRELAATARAAADAAAARAAVSSAMILA